MPSGLRKGCQEEQDLTGLGQVKQVKWVAEVQEPDPIFISVHRVF